MPDPIEIKIDNTELQACLKKLASKAENLRPLMKNIAGIMMDSVEENFEKEGSQRLSAGISININNSNTSSGSEKWTPLAKSTIKQRTKKGYWPGRILQMRGELASSITNYYDSHCASVGTNKTYAAIHQLGGNTGRNKKAKIPARPYLKLGEKENTGIIQEVQNYLQE